MNRIVQIKKVSDGGSSHRPKKYDVVLLSPNTGREKDGYMAASKEFGIGIRAARKEAKRVAELYNAIVEEE